MNQNLGPAARHLLRMLNLRPFENGCAFHLQDEVWEDIVQLAQSHHLAPFLYTQLQHKGITPPTPFKQQLREEYLKNTTRNLRLFSAFRELSERLQTNQIEMIALKGILLADMIYPTLGERVIGDLDLLVPKKLIPKAFALAAEIGYEPITESHLEASVSQKHQAPPQQHKRSGTVLEWHWHIIKLADRQPDMLSHVWSRSQPVTVSGKPAYMLSPEDQILHLAYHLTYHHDFLFGLRNLCDLTLFAAQYGDQIDWMAIGKRAGTWHLDRGIYVALQMAAIYLGAPVPELYFERFRPADYADTHLSMGIQQLLVVPAQIRQISLTRQTVMGSSGLSNQVRALWEAVFPSEAKMALRYGIPPGQQSTMERYLYRWQSLALQALKKVQTQAQAPIMSDTTLVLKRRRALSSWINHSTK